VDVIITEHIKHKGSDYDELIMSVSQRGHFQRTYKAAKLMRYTALA